VNTVLILHGWGSCAKNWQKVKEGLEKRGCKVFLPDLPGFGGNPAPQKPWSIDDYASWVSEYCEKQNLSQFFLLSHSFGGGIAVKFASRFPEKLQGLILVDPAIRRVKGPKYYLFLVMAKTGNLILTVTFLSRLKPLLRKIFYKLIGTEDYRKLDFDKTNIMKETFKKVVSEDLMCCLDKIRNKTLIIWGDQDKITPLKDGNLICRHIGNARLEVLKGVKHAPNLEAPDVLSEKVLNFINNL